MRREERDEVDWREMMWIIGTTNTSTFIVSRNDVIMTTQRQILFLADQWDVDYRSVRTPYRYIHVQEATLIISKRKLASSERMRACSHADDLLLASLFAKYVCCNGMIDDSSKFIISKEVQEVPIWNCAYYPNIGRLHYLLSLHLARHGNEEE